METRYLEVVKPTREPDYVASYGSAYWWQEMVYVSASGVIRKISIDQETGALMASYIEGNKGRPFAPNIKAEYDKWWYETFESKFLGENEDTDKQIKI